MHVFCLILGLSTFFISSGFARKAGTMLVPLNNESCVSILNESIIMVGMGCPSCTLSIRDHNLISDLMVLKIKDFDFISLDRVTVQQSCVTPLPCTLFCTTNPQHEIQTMISALKGIRSHSISLHTQYQHHLP